MIKDAIETGLTNDYCELDKNYVKRTILQHKSKQSPDGLKN